MGLGHSPSIIVDGLIFHIDPNNFRCYSGSGNTIYNLVNPSIGGTFVGFTSNPVDNTEMRSIYFDGVNDYIDIINSSSWTFTTISICLWFKKNSGSAFKGVVDKGRDNYGAWSLCIDETANRVTFKVRIGGVNRSVTTASNYSFNGWTFIAGVYDGSTLSIYQNESLSSSAAYSGSIGTNAYSIRIGADNDGNCVNGLISSVSIYNKGLTAIEVLQNYNATRKKYYPDENIVTNGLVLHIDPSKSTSYPGTGNTIYDLSGFGNTGTLSSNPVFSSLNGGQLGYNGTSQYITFGNKFSFTSENFSFTYWVFVNTFTTNQANQGPVVFWKGNYNENGYYCQINSDGSIAFVTNSPSNQITNSGARVVKLKYWHHISIVRNGSSVRVYCDGLDVTVTAATHSPSASNRDFLIANYNSFILANIQTSQFQIYNRALTQQEIQQNYNATKGRFVNALLPVRDGLVLELDAGQRASYSGTGNTWYDLSGNNLNGTLTNGPAFSGIGATSSLVFDGSNDYVDIPSTLLVSASSFTYEAVFKITTAADGNSLLSLNYSSPSSGYLVRQTTGNYLIVYTNNGTEPSISSNSTISNNTIYHLTVVQSGGSCSIYFNGTLDKTASLANPVLTSSNPTFIGRRGLPIYGAQFLGNIYTTKLYNRALSAYEVKQNFDYYRTRYNI